MASLLLLLLLHSTSSLSPDLDDLDLDAEETAVTKLMSCALIASQAIENDPEVVKLISESQHDPDSTIEKLAAEICVYCISRIPEDFAKRVLEEGLDAISDPRASELIAYNQTKYLVRGASIELTPEERELMDLLVDMMTEEDYEDEEFYGDEEEYSELREDLDYEDEEEEDWAGEEL